MAEAAAPRCARTKRLLFKFAREKNNSERRLNDCSKSAQTLSAVVLTLAGGSCEVPTIVGMEFALL